MAAVLAPYNVTRIMCDGWSFDALSDIARGKDITLVEGPTGDKSPLYMSLRASVATGRIELPNDPVLRGDLGRIRKRATAGGIRVDLPKTSDGRHCDYAPAVALVHHQLGTGASGSCAFTTGWECGVRPGRARYFRPESAFSDDEEDEDTTATVSMGSWS